MYDHLSIYLSFYLSIFLSLIFLYININTSINVSKPAIHGYPQNIRLEKGLQRNSLVFVLEFKFLSSCKLPSCFAPSAAQVTKSYFRRLPALERFYWETKFSQLKSTHST